MDKQTQSEFWTKADKTETCWNWKDSKTKDGYGNYYNNGKVFLAHRIAFELAKGRIEKNLQIDHLCRNRACVNPEHLEAVTQRENILRGNGIAAQKARQTHCIHGHIFDAENTWIVKGNKRVCRECHRIRCKASYQKRKVKGENTKNG